MEHMRLLSLDQLVQHCAAETASYLRHQPSNASYGYELMRRALAEQQSDAFTGVCNIYERLVLAWVYSHPLFPQTNEQAAYFAQSAFSSFYIALRGTKFARFSGLPPVLAYLKTCVHTAIAQYVRDQRRAQLVTLENVSELGMPSDLDMNTIAAELWDHVIRLLQDVRSRKLAQMAFVQDLKPCQIVSAYPNDWRSEREVTIALYRIRQILRNDPFLRQILGVDTMSLEHAA